MDCITCKKPMNGATENGVAGYFCIPCQTFSSAAQNVGKKTVPRRVSQRDAKLPAESTSSIVGASETFKPVRSKFNSKWQEYEGEKFQSSKELRLWKQLQLRQSAGEIHGLRRQVRFELKGLNGGKIGRYTADYAYWEDCQWIVADCKSKATITEAYGLRKKLMLDNYNIKILEL